MPGEQIIGSKDHTPCPWAAPREPRPQGQLKSLNAAATLMVALGLGLSSCADEPEGQNGHALGPNTASEAQQGTTAPISPPNVLFISIDTLRADHLDAYGYEHPTAPNLSQLAQDGALFERCIAVANWTLPTHTTLFTGLHPVVHGVEEHQDLLDPSRATLGEAFAAAGYETAGWFSNPFVGSRFGFTRGFESWTMAPTPDQMRGQFEKKGTPKGAITRSWQPEPGPRTKDYFVEQSSKPVTDRALEFLDGRNTAKPFLLFLHYNDVHSDYIPPAPFDRQHNPDYAGTLTAEDYPRNKRVNRQMDPADLAWVKSLYDGEISWVDQHIGKVIAHLDSLELTENTIVVVTSDHGEGFFEHNGKEHHYGLYDELVNIPFLVKWPARVGAGQRIAHGVSQTDVPLTILGLAGVEGLPEADGISWDRLLTEGTGPRPRPLLSKAILKPILDEDGDLLLALRTDKLTVIRQTTPDGAVTVKVFARENDPGETSPLAQSHPDSIRGLQLLELLEGRMNARRDSLDWSDTELVQDADPELLEQMRQFGYIK